jgi:hypothetical protein
MSWWSDFTSKPIDQAHQAANDVLDRAAPMITEAENRLARIAHSLLDRFTVNIEIKLNPYAKAQSVENQPTSDP